MTQYIEHDNGFYDGGVHLGLEAISDNPPPPPTKGHHMIGAATAGLIGAGIVSAGNIASTAMTNHYNRKMTEATNKANVDLWHNQNEYNHPVNQIARLKKAGLNPNLIYHSATGASGIAGTPPQMKSPKYHAPKVNMDFHAYAKAREQHARAENLITENRNIDKTYDLITSQADAQNALNVLTQKKVGLVQSQISHLTAEIAELTHNLKATPSWVSTKDNSKYAFAGRTGLGIWSGIKTAGRWIKKEFHRERNKIKGSYK
jgi:hypothetical protein